ncbi:MAG: hypothetical protein COB26_04770 [Piscirickettsiaceae bacterium]|nr:MAG: hypothetical protein COB89_00510 [Piscirickettsiaceae bacterium]PCI70300.1 MAG: hypothetical protein COB26_04770 [Piscirickettsiaceae bacterium]
MNCKEFEFEYIAAPDEIAGDACEHLQACAECQTFVEQQAAFEAQLAAVIQCDVPDGFRHSVRKHVVNHQPSFWTMPKTAIAVAASLVMAVGLVTFNKGQFNGQSFPLDRLVVEHVEHDGEHSMLASHQLNKQQLAKVSQQFGVRVNLQKGITFAEKCPIGDSYGLHMVYKYNGQQITVIYMPELSPKTFIQFNYAGLRGWIKPLEKGSVAVLGRQAIDIPSIDFADEFIEWL